MKNFSKTQILLLLGFAFSACSKSEENQGFSAARELSGAQAAIVWGQNAKERFRLEPMPHAAKGHQEGDHEEAALKLAYDLPQGWSELPSNANRIANFRVAGDEKAECYLSLLGGDGGGLEGNVNRWRAQLSIKPLTPQEVAALPRETLFQRQAVLVESSGIWKGMDGSQSQEGWSLLGLALVNPQASAFLKMTGPTATIAGERERFLALARSFRFESAPAPASKPDDSLPMGNAQGLSWTAPQGWQQAPEKPMRVVSFLPQDGIDCYVAVLDGDGGGALANFNRWRGQMGREPIREMEFDALPRILVLGTQAPLLEIEGEGESAGKKMLGLVAQVHGRSVFLKMTGPVDAIERERENFRVFAASLRENP